MKLIPLHFENGYVNNLQNVGNSSTHYLTFKNHSVGTISFHKASIIKTTYLNKLGLTKINK